MEKRRLYGDASLIELLLTKMQLVETAVGGYAAVYKDPATGAFWLKYYATAATQGGGYLTLMKLPAPSIGELIGIAITSVFEDEAVAAVLRLLDEEAIEKKEFRLELIRKLEQLHPGLEVQPDRLVKIIKFSSLDDSTNRRELLHKSQEQIQEDASYFTGIAERAKLLLERLGG
ncbi:hypothetical protein OB13_06635 [Pontibacter sp. HJ8]